ncbi:hypothetical protein pb186bvf_018421 [Paramecium bursaria]
MKEHFLHPLISQIFFSTCLKNPIQQCLFASKALTSILLFF